MTIMAGSVVVGGQVGRPWSSNLRVLYPDPQIGEGEGGEGGREGGKGRDWLVLHGFLEPQTLAPLTYLLILPKQGLSHLVHHRVCSAM